LWATATSPVVVLTCALVLAGLFGWAGIGKVRHPYPAALAAVRFQVLTRPRRAFGLTLGVWELLVAVGLFVPVARGPVAWAAAVTSSGFVVLTGAALLRGERFECACLGSPHEEIGVLGLARAGAMAVAAALVATHAGVSTGLSQAAQAVVVASIVIGVPVLVATHRRIRAQWSSLDAGLDWVWILQENATGSERR
jgi:hypothetical protein